MFIFVWKFIIKWINKLIGTKYTSWIQSSFSSLFKYIIEPFPSRKLSTVESKYDKRVHCRILKGMSYKSIKWRFSELELVSISLKGLGEGLGIILRWVRWNK